MKKEKTKVLTALASGAIIGTVAGSIGGVLLAPRKGSETRQMIKSSLSDIKDKILNVDEEKIRNYVEKKIDNIELEIAKLNAENEFKKAKKQSKKVIKKLDKLLGYIKRKKIEDFEELIDGLKEQVCEITESLMNDIEED